MHPTNKNKKQINKSETRAELRAFLIPKKEEVHSTKNKKVNNDDIEGKNCIAEKEKEEKTRDELWEEVYPEKAK
jgi:hypothetical protein